MNDETKIHRLDQYRAKEKAAESAPFPPQPLSSRHYRAYGIQPPRTKITDLRIVHHDGQVELLSKLYRSRMLLTGSEYLSMVFDDYVITLEGRHLDCLADLLQDDEIRSLRCFNPALHDQPPAEEIVITAIQSRTKQEILTGRPASRQH